MLRVQVSASRGRRCATERDLNQQLRSEAGSGSVISAATHRVGVELDGRRVFAAADAAVSLHLAAEQLPPPVELRVGPVALGLCRTTDRSETEGGFLQVGWFSQDRSSRVRLQTSAAFSQLVSLGSHFSAV